MSKIIVQDENELKRLFVEAVQIMMQMRKAQKRWHVEYGSKAKEHREDWEKKADSFLGKLEISNPEHTQKPILKMADE